MQVAAYGGGSGVLERLLHEVDGRAPIQAMAGVGMAQPMGRDLGGETGLLGGGFAGRLGPWSNLLQKRYMASGHPVLGVPLSTLGHTQERVNRV